MQRLFCLLVALPLFVQAAPVDAPPPPPVPEVAAPASANLGDEVEVRIVEDKDATIAEYRSHGKLYMIKVTPKFGPPYYLVDNEGKGKFDRGDSPAVSPLVVPRWVLFEF